jgi:hypothetical protein
VANPVLKVPGVYLQERVERTPPLLPTGVPAFIGFVTDGVGPGALLGPVLVRRKSDFPFQPTPSVGDPDPKNHDPEVSFFEQAVTGFFDNGGVYCYVVGVHGDSDEPGAAAALIAALDLLAPLTDVDLVAVPDAGALRLPPLPGTQPPGPVDEAGIRAVQSAVIRHCATLNNRVALLDAFPPNKNQNEDYLLQNQVGMLDLGGTGAVNAALYHPWIRTLTSFDKSVPPCGHMAGIIARTDAAVGVFKAPANTEIQGAIDLTLDLGTEALGKLNDKGVNCLRAFPARGLRVWGARTLSRDPTWRFLNVRRLVLTTLRWIDANMLWATFEPNVPALWARIERELSAYLRTVWNAGGLAGATESDAFFVRCNAETNPPDRREAGEVNTEIGLAPSVPAEFIVVSVQHRAGTTELL